MNAAGHWISAAARDKLFSNLPASLKVWKFCQGSTICSENMIACKPARSCLTVTEIAGRVEFAHWQDGNRLGFPDSSFDLVMCNSVLHHLAEPQNLLAEMARVAKPGAAILLRDLRRPRRFAYPLHVRWHGRHYSGAMYKLYSDSVRAAYTGAGIASPARFFFRCSRARVFTHGLDLHLGIERPSETGA